MGSRRMHILRSDALIRHGADRERRDYLRKNAMDYALENGDPQIIEALQ